MTETAADTRATLATPRVTRAGFTLSIAQSPADYEAAYRLRYTVFIDEMRMPLAAADHRVRTVRDPEDDGAVIYLVRDKDGHLIATSRSLLGASRQRAMLERVYGLSTFESRATPEAFSFGGRLAVLAAYRGSTVTQLLSLFMFNTLFDCGVNLDFLVCTPGLVRLYEQMGYRRYRAGYAFDDLGYRVPMVLDFDDLAYLDRIRSPFAAPRRLRSRLAMAFPHLRVLDREPGAVVCERYMQEIRKADSGTLSPLDQEDLKLLFRSFVVLVAEAGDRIVCQGTAGDELFVVLRGDVAEVSHSRADRSRKSILGVGETFGLQGFLTGGPRSIEAITGSHGAHLLVIDRPGFDRLRNALPVQGARFEVCLDLPPGHGRIGSNAL